MCMLFLLRIYVLVFQTIGKMTKMTENLADSLHEMTLKYSYDSDTLCKKLNKLRDKNYYENVFSWDMQKVPTDSEKNSTIVFDKTIDKIRRTLEKGLPIVTNENGLELFNLHK